MKTQTYLPSFSGFYYTIWDESDHIIDSEIQHFKDEYDKDITYDDLDIDWKQYHNERAKIICETISNVLIDENLISDYQFEKLVSPQFYNYTNDSINVEFTLTKDNIENINKVAKEYIDTFTEYVKDATTHRSGFIPYYDFTDFIDGNELNQSVFTDSHHLGFILDICLDCLGYDEFYLSIGIETTLLPITNYDELTP